MKYRIDQLYARLEALEARTDKRFDHEFREHDDLHILVAELARRVTELEQEIEAVKREQCRAVGE